MCVMIKIDIMGIGNRGGIVNLWIYIGRGLSRVL